ncbi:hypothetical protein QJS10_CPB13g01557 [Acorus calamus]|uniref:Uncharacterized protein n=1 Tax=Acorus calamus TaxID=4465 RepID=A0AAV9DFA6_ACOCL|nr:hypothetical protein QJS10_CPB13g01557 [Acorus calamus]
MDIKLLQEKDLLILQSFADLFDSLNASLSNSLYSFVVDLKATSREGEVDRRPSAVPILARRAPSDASPLYVGEEQRRFVVPTSFLSHPLFRILFEMAYSEYGFDQESGLSVPCDVSVFEEVVEAIEGGRGRFDLRMLVGEIGS